MGTPADLAVLEAAEHAIDELLAVPLDPRDVTGALDRTRRIERLGNKILAAQIDVLDVVEDRQIHRADGHASGRVFVEHANRLEERYAKRRDRARRMLAEMPAVAAGLRSGAIGICQIDRISRVYANPRVRTEFVALDGQVAVLAAALDYVEFDRRLTNWVRQADEDGTADRSRRCQENRCARMVDDLDGGWELLARYGGLTGAQMNEIRLAFVEAEFQADWAEAREIHGEATTVAHLARTFDQRDADALTRIFFLAADAFAAAPGGSRIDLSIIMDHVTYEREVQRAAGADPAPRPAPDLGPMPADDPHDVPANPSSPDGDADQHPGRRFRCETVDGHPIDPTEAFAASMTSKVRRTVVGWDGVVLNQSGLHTLFTGSLRHAVMVTASDCPWPGCHITVSHCQIDHLVPRRAGGRTDPGNGAPLCGRHNRWKEHGFTVFRDRNGKLHVLRPDGTEIE
jgi:hypothetical protein